MKRLTLLSIFVTLNFIGCTQPPPPPPKALYKEPSLEKLSFFKEQMQRVAQSIKDDKEYQRMNLDTQEKKVWFQNLMFELWDRRITRAEFIERGLQKYPSHLYEFQFVAEGFQKE